MKRVLFAASASSLVACALGPEKVPNVQYTVLFPSENAALYTDNLEVYAFENYPCRDVLRDRITGTFAKRPTVSLPSTALCALGAGPPSITVGFEPISLLVVGTRPNQVPSDVLIGCVEGTVGAGAFPLPVNLSVIPRTPQTLIPVSRCPSLAAKCGQQC